MQPLRAWLVRGARAVKPCAGIGPAPQEAGMVAVVLAAKKPRALNAPLPVAEGAHSEWVADSVGRGGRQDATELRRGNQLEAQRCRNRVHVGRGCFFCRRGHVVAVEAFDGVAGPVGSNWNRVVWKSTRK